jgi:hypothetical protein
VKGLLNPFLRTKVALFKGVADLKAKVLGIREVLFVSYSSSFFIFCDQKAITLIKKDVCGKVNLREAVRD